MPDWLELELAEELRPATAPEELWERISAAGATEGRAIAARGRRPRRALRRAAPHLPWASWPIAALVTLVIAAATFWLVAKGQEPVLDLRQLAIQELRDPLALDLQSSDPAQIGDWMQQQTGMVLCLPARNTVRLVGARVIQKGGSRIGAVKYRVGDDTATLLIAQAGSSPDLGHGHILWKARGQTYALASSNPDRPEAACLLCHASL
jgi:hypothetical protein